MKNSFIQPMAALAIMLCATSCHCHHDDAPSATFKVGQVLCTDGVVMPICEYAKSDRQAIGLVFYVNGKPEEKFRGYAVYLNDIPAAEYASGLGYAQGSSCDIEATDGNENTFALHSCQEVTSPMADAVFDMWTYGQSAYVPSVAQMTLLAAQREKLNARLAALGGDPLPGDADDCWYWTSTEVAGQATDKAWLYSLNGTIQETPKNQPHKVRPIITIY